jgi:hypothetical protein
MSGWQQTRDSGPESLCQGYIGKEASFIHSANTSWDLCNKFCGYGIWWWWCADVGSVCIELWVEPGVQTKPWPFQQDGRGVKRVTQWNPGASVFSSMKGTVPLYCGALSLR